MMFLNYNHLRYFWAVVREGGLRQAGERLNVTQPTISAQISALEASLGEKLLRKSGRKLVLTEAGQHAYEIAEQIFPLGQELVDRVQGANPARRIRLAIGIADSLPKLLSWEAIEPALALPQGVQISCSEGHSLDLLAQLARGRLDMVMTDEPAPSSLPVRVFSHELGVSATSFWAVPALARKLLKGFPGSLHGAPVVLPLSSTAWRHALDAWFLTHNIRPDVVAEFEDAALMKVAAASGLGAVPVPLAVEKDVQRQYRMEKAGCLDACQLRYYAITAQRRVTHPAVAAIMKGAPGGKAPRVSKEKPAAAR